MHFNFLAPSETNRPLALDFYARYAKPGRVLEPVNPVKNIVLKLNLRRSRIGLSFLAHIFS